MTMLRSIRCDRCNVVSAIVPDNEYLNEWAHAQGWTSQGRQHSCPNCRYRNVKKNAKATVEGMRDQIAGVLTPEQLHALDVLLYGTALANADKVTPLPKYPNPEQAALEAEQLRLAARAGVREMTRSHPKSAQARRQEKRKARR